MFSVLRASILVMIGIVGLGASVGCGDEKQSSDLRDTEAGARDTSSAVDIADVGDVASEETGADSSDGRRIEPIGEVVRTESGKLRGRRQGEVWSYRGIPFAKAPVGRRRWRAPVPPEGWEGTRDATQFGPMCPQTGTWGEEPPPCSSCEGGDAECRQFCQAEDCLNLNVWTPAEETGDALPVMVWFHGGSYVSGAGSLYDGAKLAERGDVVVVTVNYRLGPLGTMAHAALEEEACSGCGSANYGLWDQIRALRWVRKHIEVFGGDSEQVTVFGESAGGSSVCQLMTSQMASGLVDRAIMQSGICASVMRPASVQEQQCNGVGKRCPSLQTVREQGLWDCIAMECVGELLAEQLGCAGAGDTLACLRNKDAAAVLEALPVSQGFGEPGMVYSRFVDGQTLQSPPGVLLYQGLFRRVPFMMGTTADEMTLFFAPDGPSIDSVGAYEARLEPWGVCSDELVEAYPAETAGEAREAYLELLADQWYTCATNLSAKWAAGHGVDTYLYRFTHVPLAGKKDLGDGYRLGAYHSAELPLLFGDIPTPESTPGCKRKMDGSWRCCDEQGRCWRPVDRRVSEAMMDYWISFAQNGVPQPDGRPAWPVYRPGQRYLRLEEPPAVDSGLQKNQCQVWEGVWGHVYRGSGYCYD